MAQTTNDEKATLLRIAQATEKLFGVPVNGTAPIYPYLIRVARALEKGVSEELVLTEITKKGYYYGGEFYKDRAHTETLDKAEGCLYLDLTDPNNPALYVWGGTEYVQISGGASSSGQFVGSLTNDTTVSETGVYVNAFPTARLDGSALGDKDYVRMHSSATFPMTIGTLTFENSRDEAIYFGGVWYRTPGVLQATEETPVSDKEEESLSKESTNQAQINIENKEAIEKLQVRSDVVDVVDVYDRGTDTSKTDLVHYDTEDLSDKDVVKVFSDETHDKNIAYYRYNIDPTTKVGSFSFIRIEDVIQGIRIASTVSSLTTEQYGILTSNKANYIIVDDEKRYVLEKETALEMYYRNADVLEEEANSHTHYFTDVQYIVVTKATKAVEFRDIDHALVIEASENVTVNNESVPKLSDEQVTLAYNAYVEGLPVIIKDEEAKYFVLENADSVTDAGETTVKVRIVFEDKMILTYTLNDDVVITYENIDDVVFGYYDLYGTKKFYKEDTFETELDMQEDKLYVNLGEDKGIYRGTTSDIKNIKAESLPTVADVEKFLSHLIKLSSRSDPKVEGRPWNEFFKEIPTHEIYASSSVPSVSVFRITVHDKVHLHISGTLTYTRDAVRLVPVYGLLDKAPAKYVLVSSASRIIYGYYDKTADKFYKESIKTTELEAEEEVLYIDKTDNKFRQYEYDGTKYVALTQDVIARETVLPEATEDTPDFVEVNRDLYWKRTEEDMPFSTKTKKDDYLYQFDYTNFDDDFAYPLLIKTDVDAMACSAVRNGNFFGKNNDWKYNEEVSAIVKVTDMHGRYDSIAVCSGLSEFTKAFVEGSGKVDTYKLLPYLCSVGINSNGVFACMNVVPLDKGSYTRTKVTQATKTIPMIALVRYILDFGANAMQIVNDLKNNVVLTANKSLKEQNLSLHFMVGDETNNYILEVLPNGDGTFSLDVHETDVSRSPYDNMIMTNFYLNDIEFKVDGSVYTPERQTSTEDAVNFNHITDYGEGLERYNLIVDGITGASTKAGMISLMHSLDYRRMYNSLLTVFPDGIWGGLEVPSEFWYTEYVGGSLKVNSDPSAFDDAKSEADTLFTDRDRSTGETWHTAHSVVIDIASKAMTVFSPSESETAYEVTL